MKQEQITYGFVAGLANDIAEDIDNKESRETLRACIGYLWDDRIKREIQGNAAKRMQDTIKVANLVIAMLEADANAIATAPGAEEHKKMAAEAEKPEPEPGC
jgi:hypothetical protein